MQPEAAKVAIIDILSLAFHISKAEAKRLIRAGAVTVTSSQPGEQLVSVDGKTYSVPK